MGMRSLPQFEIRSPARAWRRRTKREAWVLLLVAAGIFPLGCAGSISPQPPPPPPTVQVSVKPTSGSVLLGNTQLFAATVTGTTDTGFSWSVNGVAGGNAATGTIAPDGTYTAPGILPTSPAVQITATSHADATKSATASITIISDIVVGTPQGNASVELGATQAFQVSITSAGHPSTAVNWSLSGAACASGCGSVDASGNFTAPQILPMPASVTLTATSAADPTKQNSASIALTSNFTLQLAAPASLTAGQSATLTATLTPVPNSNPSRVMSWSLTGADCSGAACGTLTGITTQPGGGNSTVSSATYTAPVNVGPPASVMVAVTPQADASKKVLASIALQPASTTVTLSPTTATAAANHRVTLTAMAPGITNVNWSVNNIPGGSIAVGQICVVSSSPCVPVTTGNILQVDYVAPGAIPGSNPVTVQVSNAADARQSATAQITVINHVLVSVLPGNVTLPPLGVQGFTASVEGTSDQRIVWQVQGAACTGGGVCGGINSSGTYTAPAAAPVPDAIQIVAISSDDNTQSGIANVTISMGANILTLHPASVYAGGAAGFTLRAEGSGFVASSPGPGSALWIGGTSRVTLCAAATNCSGPVTPADVAQAGSVSVQVRNADGTLSNAVSLLVVAPGQGVDQISLTSTAPTATGKDIVVVDPTTAGLDVPGFSLDMSIAALGTFVPATNTCTLGGSPVPLQRPASGIASTDICIFSQSSFDTSMSYAVSGPGDVAIISKQPAGLGIIHLTLQIPANALPGARTIFIQNSNLDETAASGVLEIQ
jgi:hypothetical protein